MDPSFGFAQQPALPKFTIPKKRQKIEENGAAASRNGAPRDEPVPVWKLSRPDKGSPDYSDFLKNLKYSEEKMKNCCRITNVQFIENTGLKKKFEQFKKKLKTLKLQDQENICYRILFDKNMIKPISQKGLSTGSSYYSDLGNTNNGVYLMNNLDLVSAAPLAANVPITVMAFKVLKGGRPDRVGLGSFHLEPSRSCVAHEPTGAAKAKKEKWRLKKYRMNQSFFYEIDQNTDEVVRYPSGVLPIAVFELIPETSKPFASSCGIIPEIMDRLLFTWTPRKGIMRREELELHTFMEDQCKPTFMIKNVGFNQYVKMSAVSTHPVIQKMMLDEETWGRLLYEEEVPIYECDGEEINIKYCAAAYFLKNKNRDFGTFVNGLRAKRYCLMGMGFEGGLIFAIPPSEFSFRLGLPLLNDPVLYILVIKEHSIFDFNENVLRCAIKDKLGIGVGSCSALSSKALRSHVKQVKIYEEILKKAEKTGRQVPKTLREREKEQAERAEQQRNLQNGRSPDDRSPGDGSPGSSASPRDSDRPGNMHGRIVLGPPRDPDDDVVGWDYNKIPIIISAPPPRKLKNLIKVDYNKTFAPKPIKGPPKGIVWGDTVPGKFLNEFSDGTQHNIVNTNSTWAQQHGGAQFNEMRRQNEGHEFRKQGPPLPQKEASQIFRDALNDNGSNYSAPAQLAPFQDPTLQKKSGVLEPSPPLSIPPPMVNRGDLRDVGPIRFPTHFNYQQQHPQQQRVPPPPAHNFDRRQEHQERYQDHRRMDAQDYRRQEFPERRNGYPDNRHQEHQPDLHRFGQDPLDRHHDNLSGEHREREERDYRRDDRRDDRHRDVYRRPDERNDYRRHEDRQPEKSNGGGRHLPLPVVRGRHSPSKKEPQPVNTPSPGTIPYTPKSPEPIEFNPTPSADERQHTQNNDVVDMEVDMEIDSDPNQSADSEPSEESVNAVATSLPSVEEGDDPYDVDYDKMLEVQFNGNQSVEQEAEKKENEDEEDVEDEAEEECKPLAAAPVATPTPPSLLKPSIVGTQNDFLLNLLGALKSNGQQTASAAPFIPVHELDPPASPTGSAPASPPASPPRDPSSPPPPASPPPMPLLSKEESVDISRILNSLPSKGKDVDMRSSQFSKSTVGRDVDLRHKPTSAPLMIRTVANVAFQMKKQEAPILAKSKLPAAFTASNEDEDVTAKSESTSTTSDSHSHRDDRSDRSRSDRDRDRERSRHDRDDRDRDSDRRRHGSSRRDDDYRRDRDRDERRGRDEDYRRERDDDRRERDGRGDDRDYRSRRDDRRDRRDERDDRGNGRSRESSSRYGRENGSGKEIPLPPPQPAAQDSDHRVHGIQAFMNKRDGFQDQPIKKSPPTSRNVDVKPMINASKVIKLEPPASPDPSPVKRSNSNEEPQLRTVKRTRTDSAEEGEIHDDVDTRPNKDRFDAPIGERMHVRSPVPQSAVGSLDAPPLIPVQPHYPMMQQPPPLAMMPPGHFQMPMGAHPMMHPGFHPQMWANGVPPVTMPPPQLAFMQQQQRQMMMQQQQQMAFAFGRPPPSLAVNVQPHDHLCIIPDTMAFVMVNMDDLRQLLQKMAELAPKLKNGCSFEPHHSSLNNFMKSSHGIGAAQMSGANIAKLFDEYARLQVVHTMRQHDCDNNSNRTNDKLFRCVLGIADNKRQMFQNPKIIFLTNMTAEKCIYMGQPLESKGIRILSMKTISSIPSLLLA